MGVPPSGTVGAGTPRRRAGRSLPPVTALQQRYWDGLQRFQPVAYFWWTGQRPASWWPRWDEAEREAERRYWLALAPRSAPVADPQAQLWARWGRRAALRLNEEGWRHPALPLAYARMVVTALAVAASAGQGSVHETVWAGGAEWLADPRLAAVVWRGDAMDDAELLAEADALRSCLDRWPGSTGASLLAAAQWGRAVDAYLAAVMAKSPRALPRPPWIPVAMMDADGWRRAWEAEVDALSVGRAPAAAWIARWELPGAAAEESWPWPHDGGWVHRSAGAPIVRVLEPNGPDPWMRVLAWWMAATSYRPLSWALADGAMIEGKVAAWVDRLAEAAGLPAVEGRRCRVLALADAYLWLGAGDPRLTAERLGGGGFALVAALRRTPGYAMGRYLAYLDARAEQPSELGAVLEGWRPLPAGMAQGPLASWPRQVSPAVPAS